MYQNTAGATAVVLYHQDQVLFTVRNEEPAKGKLDLAGGFIDQEETAEDCIKRELMEELRININTDLLKYLGSEPNTYNYKNITYPTIDLYFAYPITPVTFDFNMSEIRELKWLNINDLEIDQLAFKSHQLFFTKYKKGHYKNLQ